MYENSINRGEENNSDVSTNELVGLGSDLPITCQIAFSSRYLGDMGTATAYPFPSSLCISIDVTLLKNVTAYKNL